MPSFFWYFKLQNALKCKKFSSCISILIWKQSGEQTTLAMELNISDYRKRYSEYTIEEFCKINESVPQNFKYLLVLDFKVTCGNEEFELIREEDAVVLGIFITVYIFFNFAGIIKSWK